MDTAVHTVFICAILVLIKGSKIDLSVTPGTEFINGLTGVLTLRCSLSDTPVQGSVTGSVIGRRDVIATSQNVHTVTSLVLMKDGSEVAAITIASPAVSYSNATNIGVTGDLSTSKGQEKGYLAVSWTAPTAALVAGEFTCEANAISVRGHNLVFSTTAEVGARDPTVADLVTYIREIQVDLAAIKKENEELKHSEMGSVQCGFSLHYPFKENIQGLTSAHDPRQRIYKLIDVPFDRPYDHIPNVKVGVDEYVEWDGHPVIRWGAAVTNVTRTGFTLKCSTWTDAQLWKLDVSWVSVPRLMN